MPLTIESVPELLTTIKLVHELMGPVVVMYMYEVVVVVRAENMYELLVTVEVKATFSL